MTEQFIKNILSEELFGYRICESVEDTQIVNYVYNRLLLEKLLYGEPISVPELRKLLRKKIVNFEFIKLDGEVRPAKGTTMMKYIPPADHPKGIRPSSPKVATFFDLDKDAWRSVSRRSKELVLKKDEKTDKPIVVVKDKSKIKVKPVSKERESTDPIEQGGTYKYTTNRGTNTHVEVIREMPSGLLQVSSPVFKTTFAVDPNRLGDRFNPEPEEKETAKVEKPIETPPIQPKEEKPKEPIEKPIEEPIKEPAAKKPKVEKPKPQAAIGKTVVPVKPKPPEKQTTVLLPKQINTGTPAEQEEPTKAPPADITPPTEEEERPEDLSK